MTELTVFVSFGVKKNYNKPSRINALSPIISPKQSDRSQLIYTNVGNQGNDKFVLSPIVAKTYSHRMTFVLNGKADVAGSAVDALDDHSLY